MLKITNFPNQYQVSKKENLQEIKLLKKKPDNGNIALADHKTGQAIFAQRAVTFKKIPIVLNLTPQYQQAEKIKLSNIHVFEFQNTNLKAFINVYDNITTSDKSFLEQPQIIIQVLNNMPVEEQNIYADELIKQIIKSKMKEKSDYILDNVIENNKTYYSFTEWAGENVIQNIHNLNAVIFNLNIEDSDVENAKKLLANDNFKNISTKSLQEYYKSLRNNLSANAYITVSKDYYDSNKNKIFSELNKNITLKLKKTNSEDITVPRQKIIEEFAVAILNANKEFNNEFFAIRKSNNSYKIISKNNFDKNKYSQILHNIMNQDLQDIIPQAKEAYLQKITKILTDEEELSLVKNITLANLGNNPKDFENVINSIEENEIKKSINSFFIEQIPEIELCKNEDRHESY